VIIPRSLLAAAALPLAAGVPVTAWAQRENSPPPAAAPTTIVVTGRGLADTPATPAYDIQTLGRDALNSSSSGRIEDVLSGVAGFQQFRRSDSRSSNPSAQGVTLRALGGNATSRTLVLLDGVPLADPFFGFIPLSAIAPDRLASARITRGGGSGAFGAGAVAGTIDLTSASARELGLLTGEALVDNRGETELAGTLGAALVGGFAELGGSWDRGQGFWTTPANQRVPASVRARYDSWSLNLRDVVKLSNVIELQAHGMIYHDSRTLRFASAISQSQGQDASLRLVGRGRWQFDVLAYLQARGFANVVVSSSTFRPVLNEYRTPSTGIGSKLELRPPVGGGHLLKLGSDLRIGSGHTDEASESATTGAVTARRIAGGRNSDTGLFAEDDWSLGRLVLTAGARADHWTIANGFFRQTTPAGAITTSNQYPNRGGWQGSYRAGGVLSMVPALKLRAAAYSQLRQPTLNELTRPFTIASTTPGVSQIVTTNANAALANELLHGFEIGFDLAAAPGATFSLTAFADKLDHAIGNRTVSITTSVNPATRLVTRTTVQQRINLDAIRARGLELDGHAAAGRFTLDASLALIDAIVEASGSAGALNGLRPAQTPKIAASTTLGWHPQPGWDAALTLRHIGAQYEDDLETNILPAVTVLGAYVQLPLAGAFSLVLRGENLTDTRVETRNQAGSIDLGAPRTVWAGVKLRVR
jgi:vitamin B12 transporter